MFQWVGFVLRWRNTLLLVDWQWGDTFSTLAR